MKKRCPWCGEQVHIHFTRSYHCRYCNNKSKVYTDGWIYAIGALIIFVSFIALRQYFKISVSFVLIVWYVLTNLLLPLKIDSKHYIPRKSAHASIKLLCKYSFLRKRFSFSENKLFVICFIDVNDIPVSHMLCISTEDVKFISKDQFECNIKFIPLSTIKTEFSKGTKFYIFNDKEKIAYGELTSDVKETVHSKVVVR